MLEFLDRNIPKKEGKVIWDTKQTKINADQSKRLFHPSSKLFLIKDKTSEDDDQ